MKELSISGIPALLLFFILGMSSSCQKLPIGGQYEEADQKARDMLIAINDSAWQITNAIEWNFMGNHEHLWDKERQLSRVRWKKYEVIFDINKVEGIAFKKDIQLEGDDADKMVTKAWKLWINDSFWLNPISKIFDDGTTRSLVTTKNGEQGVLVSYSTGGNTPGDSYLWLIDENNLPYAWKLWVSAIPFGGLRIPWSEWIITETGVKICIEHDAKIMSLKMKDVRTAYSLDDLTGGEDPFGILNK